MSLLVPGLLFDIPDLSISKAIGPFWCSPGEKVIDTGQTKEDGLTKDRIATCS